MQIICVKFVPRLCNAMPSEWACDVNGKYSSSCSDSYRIRKLNSAPKLTQIEMKILPHGAVTVTFWHFLHFVIHVCMYILIYINTIKCLFVSVTVLFYLVRKINNSRNSSNSRCCFKLLTFLHAINRRGRMF